MQGNEWGLYVIPTGIDPENRAISRLKIASDIALKKYGSPLVITFSGGKDSSVLIELAYRSGIPFEISYSHTTVDAPETIYFIRNEFKRMENKGVPCSIIYPTYKGYKTSMWKLIPQKLMPPTRISRYCCGILKENSNPDRMIATGVRWAESSKRAANRGIFERQVSNKEKSITTKNDADSLTDLFSPCKLKAKYVVNPIVDWTTEEIWDFISDAKIPVNPLYECGLKRVGCIGCPMAGKKRYDQFARWPSYEKMYLQAFEKMLLERQRRGLKTNWKNATDVFEWWMK